MGLIDNKKKRLPGFTSRLTEIMDGKNNTEFAKDVGLSRQPLGYYLNGDRLPDAENIVKICQKCGVSSDYLLGLKEVTSPDNNIKTTCNTTGLSDDAVVAICGINASAPSLIPYLNKMLEPHHGSDFSKILADISLYISNVNFESDYNFDTM